MLHVQRNGWLYADADIGPAPARTLPQEEAWPTNAEIWAPSQSYPGGLQEDSRLDQPVRFWHAGLTLTEVFAAIEKQTAVHVGFWPADDENARVRVNLYLNHEQPPTLRSLMAQLAWVTQCNLAFDAAGSNSTPTYYLLRTSIGAVDEAAIAAEARRDRQQGAAKLEMAAAEIRDGLRHQLVSYSEALTLPRSELVRRYRGKDDFLLLTMLDPRRRAAAEFVCALARDQSEGLLQGEDLSLEWDDLTSEEHEDLSRAFDLGAILGQGKAVRFWVGGARSSIIAVGAEASVSDSGAKWESLGDGYWVVLSTRCPADQMMPADQIALRRYLGEHIGPELERSLLRQLDEQRATSAEGVSQEQPGSLTENPTTAPETKAILARTQLPLAAGEDYALWTIQELVARLTGFNVISDCFWDVPRGVFGPGGSADSSALGVLTVACRAQQDRAEMSRDWSPESVRNSLAWEWGDAGSFLRFRSLHRDVFRAGLLPPDAVAWMDRWFDPYVSEAIAAKSPQVRVSVPVDLRQLAGVVGGLDTMQMRFGWGQIYEEPASPAGVVKQALREELGRLVFGAPMLRAFSTFSEDQWRRVRGEGLSLSHDLTPDQQSAMEAFVARAAALSGTGEAPEEVRMYLDYYVPSPGSPDYSPGLDLRHFRLVMRDGDEVVGVTRIPAKLRTVITLPVRPQNASE